ncbi:MAG TPA: polyprenyl synthetase family protein [archaeon]|nr:polyprenyl synthetase family protein [archaeon]
MTGKKGVDIEGILREKAPVIDRIIGKFIPQKIDAAYLEFACGKTKYEFDYKALNKTLAEPLWELLKRGGKRWRPGFFLLVCESLECSREEVLDFAVIPEVIHNGTLMIDDIEDESDVRRGKPAIHKLYGNDVAINAGNAMYYLPLLPFMKHSSRFPAETLRKAYEVYVQEMINISIGQAMDIAWHKGWGDHEHLSEDQYLQMCAYKTGTLARMSARLAALLSGGTPKQVEKIGAFAETIGVAFQIQDDVLDILNTVKTRTAFGKAYGNDIKEGKKTLMVIHALKNSILADRKRLLKLLSMHSNSRKVVSEAISLLQKHDSIGYAQARAKELIRESWDGVDVVLKENPAKQKLKAFADYLIEREY